MSSDFIDTMRRADVFWGLEREDVVVLAEVLPQLRLAAGEHLCKQGSMGASMFVILEGRVQVRVSDPRGQTTTVGVLGPGETVGEMACIDPSPRSAAVLAVQPTLALELSSDNLATIEDVAPAIAATVVTGIIRHVTQRLRQTNERIEMELRRAQREPGRKPSLAPVSTSEGRTAAPKAYRGVFPWREAPLPEGLQQGDLETLASAGRLMVYEPGAVLCLEGKPGASCFVVLEGSVEVFKASLGGGRHLAMLGPGSLLGQLALVDSSPHSASVRAQERVVALEVGRDVFERLVRAASPFALRFQRQIALSGTRQLRLADARLASLLDQGEGKDERGAAEREPKLQRVQTALYEWDVSIED